MTLVIFFKVAAVVAFYAITGVVVLASTFLQMFWGRDRFWWVPSCVALWLWVASAPVAIPAVVLGWGWLTWIKASFIALATELTVLTVAIVIADRRSAQQRVLDAQCQHPQCTLPSLGLRSYVGEYGFIGEGRYCQRHHELMLDECRKWEPTWRAPSKGTP